MSAIDTIEAFDKLEFNDLRSFATATALIAKSIEDYNQDPTNGLSLLFDNQSDEIIARQKDLEREWTENSHEIM